MTNPHTKSPFRQEAWSHFPGTDGAARCTFHVRITTTGRCNRGDPFHKTAWKTSLAEAARKPRRPHPLRSPGNQTPPDTVEISSRIGELPSLQVAVRRGPQRPAACSWMSGLLLVPWDTPCSQEAMLSQARCRWEGKDVDSHQYMGGVGCEVPPHGSAALGL